MIIVIGVLAAVTVFGFTNISGGSLSDDCHADARAVVAAQEAYRVENQTFSPDVATLLVPAKPGPYLRPAPRHANKYVITTDSTGHVFVAKAPYGSRVDFKNSLDGSDPCARL